MKVDPRFLTEEGPEVFVGNELVLKGALETEGGVHLLSGYPGSPAAGFFDAIAQVKDLLNEKGIRAVIAHNEALAAAMVNGSQTVGCRTIVSMKSVGVHVAADGLSMGNLTGTHPDGGALVIYGDDPWSDSTQAPADSRYISKHLFMPVLEPCDPQEVKDFVDLALKLSRGSGLYIGYVVSTNLADGGGSVQCRPNRWPAFSTRQKLTIDTSALDLERRVLLPPNSWSAEERLAPRLARCRQLARELGLNRILHAGAERAPLGFVTGGLAYGYLVQALDELGLAGRYPILKFGVTYPVDEAILREFATGCERLVVVEERRGFLEEQVAQILLRDRQQGLPCGRVEVWGKAFPDGLEGLPETRGLHPSLLIERLVPLFKHLETTTTAPVGPAGPEDAGGRLSEIFAAMDREVATIDSTARTDVEVPARTPTFCPGCPHRDTAGVCLEIKKRLMDPQYMRRKYDRGPVDLVFHGDAGCYVMLMYPPNEPLMHDYSGMGLGGGTGAGIDTFITNKKVVFMGDGTFFHSGQIAVSQAIKFGQDVTFVILDNSITAMTGHQPTPGIDWDIAGNPTAVQDIEEVINGMAGDSPVPVLRVDPEQRRPYAALLERTFLQDGVKVIIADKECGIMRHRRTSRERRAIERENDGVLPAQQFMNINAEVCRFCLACAEMTACPGLRHVETDYGLKMDTDLTWCVDDGACSRVGACWSFERVTVKRRNRPRMRAPELELDHIPEPAARPLGGRWQCYLTGIGGQGIGLATSILVRAGLKEGHHVRFVDKKGLAIRNGGINSQIVFTREPQPVTGIIPYGKADLLLGVDVLEAARALDPRGRGRVGDRQRTAAVINTTENPTILSLMGLQRFDVADLQDLIRRHTRQDDFMARDISRICQKYLGSKLYANIMMLGFAFQKGLIPVSLHAIAWAIRDTIRVDWKRNLYAFNMGRKLCEDPQLFQGPPRRASWKDVLEDRCRHTIRRRWRGQRAADRLRAMAEETIDAVADLPETLKRDLVVRLYDTMRWGGEKYARQYADGVRCVYAGDAAQHQYEATRAVIHNLAHAMLIKDAVFIAELSTSPEKYARDREKYNVNPANGDRIAYRHLLYSTLRLRGREWRFQWTARDWMLKALRSMRGLRRVLPRWHRTEREFRRRYLSLVQAFAWTTPQEYRQRLVALSSASCMDCMNPRCQESGCPLGNRIPEFLELACHGQWREAAETLHETNNFPEFTATICPAPCQTACKHALHEYPVQIRSVEREIIEQAFVNGWIAPRPPQRRSGKRVAIVGSGPAGLAAAQQLARAGHDVTVFEKDDRVGGLLRWGIPAYRLDKTWIDRRVDQLVAEGVTFRTGVEIGRDMLAAELRTQFDAVGLAVGTPRPRDLDVPGRRHGGVHFATDFLRQANRLAAGDPVAPEQRIDAHGKVVVVLGGGETGNDCVDIAIQQGAREVHQFEILPRAAVRMDLTHEQPAGVQRRWCVATKAFDGNGHGVTAVRAVEVQWVRSRQGRRMFEVPGSEFDVRADLALLALGFETAVPQTLAEQLHLKTDERGRVVVDGCATSVQGVFAAGDVVTGPSLVATAIASGRKAAEKIDAFLARA